MHAANLSLPFQWYYNTRITSMQLYPKCLLLHVNILHGMLTPS